LRFLADGPDLPDELLAARDEGRVLFFCGAGVSRARAGLPDFLGLAKAVLRELRVLPESPAYKLVERAESHEPIAGVGGLLAADRVFGLLEREFIAGDIEAAVGKALKPGPTVDLSAHKILLDLSRDAAGKSRLVTTNFELLFERAAPKLPTFTPNSLPRLKSGLGFEGIVHLHGMFDVTYNKAVGGNLVLSSAEFGRAYLAEGWATEFIRVVINKFLIVFVGYAADDPPVQYLLEALNRVAENAPHDLYAFQAGGKDEANALWSQKGVRAIAYDPSDHHAGMWRTLDAWAGRARNPEGWRKKLIRRGMKGPNVLEPHERGQIVHLATTEEGARAIAQSNPPLPATWLCVFDPVVRYAPVGKTNPMKADEPDIDPFLLFAIDSDPAPSPADSSQPFKRREPPMGVVDVFAPKPTDHREASGRFRGRRDGYAPELSPRLAALSNWLWRVCGQPAAAWWGAGQAGLHPSVVAQLEFALDRRDLTLPPIARTTWRYLFESWKFSGEPDYWNLFALSDAIKKDGWTKPLIRRFADAALPTLIASRPYWGGILPPAGKRWPRLRALVNLEVQYPERHVKFEIPDEELVTIVPLLRHNLEYAVDLDHEINPSIRLHIAPINPDPNLVGESSERRFGVSAWVLDFVELFRRLVQHDSGAAKQELAAWRAQDDPVFMRLRIWAAGLDNFLDDASAGEILATCGDMLFWGPRDQRDLLSSLQSRWKNLPSDSRQMIESRLLNGPPRVKGATAEQNKLWRASAILDRVTWLRKQGCNFERNVDKALARMQETVPQWKPEEADRAADSNEARGGFVTVDKSFDVLAGVPIGELIPRALSGHRRVWGSMQEHDPFAGLSDQRPLRLLAALSHELRNGSNVAEAWTKFLYGGTRRTEKPKIALLIAKRLTALPEAVLESIVMPTCYWLDAVHRQLFPCHAPAIYNLFDRLVAIIARNPASAERIPSKIGQRQDWVNVALGSAAGNLCEVMFGDVGVHHLGADELLPPSWIERAERLLAPRPKRLKDSFAKSMRQFQLGKSGF
jgi:hypothetical protein